MRKIEEAMRAAIIEHKDWNEGNTEVRCAGGRLMYVYLFGNLIATIDGTVASFTLAGYNTAVTRSRLRALGADIYGKQGMDKRASFDGREIDSKSWYNFTFKK